MRETNAFMDLPFFFAVAATEVASRDLTPPCDPQRIHNLSTPDSPGQEPGRAEIAAL
jgi:hypothetical protein